MVTDSPIFQSTTPKLANDLFTSFVLDSRARVMQSYFEELSQKSGFRQEALERNEFIYLIANIVVAVGLPGKSRPEFLNVMPYFRKLANAELQKRWQMSEADADTEIQNAAQNLAELILNDPEVNRGQALKWAQQWLKNVGVEEWNTVFIFRVSFSWRVRYLSVAEFLAQVRILPA